MHAFVFLLTSPVHKTIKKSLLITGWGRKRRRRGRWCLALSTSLLSSLSSSSTIMVSLISLVITCPCDNQGPLGHLDQLSQGGDGLLHLGRHLRLPHLLLLHTGQVSELKVESRHPSTLPESRGKSSFSQRPSFCWLCYNGTSRRKLDQTNQPWASATNAWESTSTMGVLHRGQRSRQADAGEASRDTLPCLRRRYTTFSGNRKSTLSRPTLKLSWRSRAIANMSKEKNNLFLTEESPCGIGRLVSLQRLYLVQQQILNYIWWDSSQLLRWNILTKRCPWFFSVS